MATSGRSNNRPALTGAALVLLMALGPALTPIARAQNSSGAAADASSGVPAPTPGPPATILVPASAPDPAYLKNLPPPSAATQVPQALPPGSPGGPGSNTWSGDPVVEYEHAQNPSRYGIGSSAAQGFMLNDEDDSSSLGFIVRPDHRKLKDGEDANGLLVISVSPNGAAAKAGLKGYQRAARSAVEAVAVGAALVFPPAMFATLLVPVIESTSVGDRYDMIVGIDGNRVSSLPEFEDSMRDAQPGEIVYLNLVRNGRRLQLPVTVPADQPAPTS